MSFLKYDNKGIPLKKRIHAIDCQAKIKSGEEKILAEQNHKGVVDINEIVRKSGGFDRIASTQNIQAMEYNSDPYDNFEEMANLVARGNEAFMSLPAKVRDEFANSPARYMDYVRNPENKDKLIERGWMNPPPTPPEPIQVSVTNPPAGETPPAE